ncbi:MAG: hypothetical protein QNI87_09910 [Erythrobacter sp.]|uniref:hypothetical protein n=1 Tax=Erythrobacter sp. TaxID=1042 RepID=UPI00260C8FFE|nr:hypothetical protein [Erythrobacter sp.]MDJ0978842.1 hypothetical protein [Erythrobacter sp.]
MALSPLSSLNLAENTALDGLFYDLDALSRDERTRLRHPSKVEGMILEVGPSWDASLRVWYKLSQCEGLAKRYRAITVAGVGSSALGAAALARNVADAVRGRVLAVVSGHGVADIASEAMGGFFLFGGLNAMRHGVNSFDRTVDAIRALNPWLPSPPLSSVDPGQGFQLASFSEDVKALMRLLAREVETDWLVGHSKGNLVISEALYALRARHPKRFETVAREVPIVTFGARIAMPNQIERVIDVMGDLDSFGALNSRPDIAVDVTIPNAWHHTNTRLPFHVPVTKVLEKIARG